MDEVKRIAQTGDLILEVGSSKARLLVSSTVLINLSKVFAALLGPHFKEGQVRRSAENPQVIELPEDDATAMAHMCMLLHCQAVPDFWNPGSRAATQDIADACSRELVDLAIVTDKYDCVDVLRLQINGLIWDFLDRFKDGNVETCRVANAAWLLRLPRAFRAATKQILREHCYLPSLRASMLPAKVYYTLQHRHLAVQEFIIRNLAGILIGNCTCGCDTIEYNRAEDFMDFYQPGERLVPSGIIEDLPRYIGKDRLRCNTCDVIEYIEVEEFIGEVERICYGLCLRRLRSHEAEDPLNNCSITDHVC